MRRTWKILIALLIGLAVLLAVNTLVVDGETKDAEVTIDGGRILSLPGGDVQVYEEGAGRAAPIVLLHCYACSLHWWDGLAPILAEDRRVIRIDLLGHGGSQKPSGGYGIDEQAGLVAGALDRLGVQGAVVVGHSMGFSVATALAERASQLVDRLVNIDEGPSEDSCSLAFIAKLGYTPVIGQAMWRVTPSFAIEDGYADAFAPGYDLADGFPNPDQVVDDFRAMTYTSFNDANDAATDYVERGHSRPAPAPDPGAAALDLRRRGPDLRPGDLTGRLRDAARRPGRRGARRRPLAQRRATAGDRGADRGLRRRRRLRPPRAPQATALIASS